MLHVMLYSGGHAHSLSLWAHRLGPIPDEAGSEGGRPGGLPPLQTVVQRHAARG